MDLNLGGRKALITGASKGIGRAIVTGTDPRHDRPYVDIFFCRAKVGPVQSPRPTATTISA